MSPSPAHIMKGRGEKGKVSSLRVFPTPSVMSPRLYSLQEVWRRKVESRSLSTSLRVVPPSQSTPSAAGRTVTVQIHPTPAPQRSHSALASKSQTSPALPLSSSNSF
jgi:hypothetical protein